MTTVIAHRGPDADGFYIGEGIGLGHRRLSIIDLATGDQPLANEDRTSGSSSTARSTTSPTSAPELEAQSATASARTPTPKSSSTPTSSGATRASIASAACSRSRLWDERKRRLLLVRDRLGVKPLYYARDRLGRDVRVGDQGAARGSRGAARLERRKRSTPTSRSPTCRARRPSTAASRSCRRRICWSPSAGR